MSPAHDGEQGQFLQRAREIAEQFHVTADGAGAGHVELELLPGHLHTYDDEGRDIHKGVVFAWCHGKNPEALLCVELYSDRVSIELTKLSNAKVVAEGLGRRWETGENVGACDQPYWSFRA